MPLSPRTLRPANTFTPRSISGLALWLDAADSSSLYTTDAGPVTAVSSPTEISGCALWLDGADATSMFDATSGGSNVPYGNVFARWEDKSGNGRHFTATGTARPTLTPSGLNGRSVVTFDGTDDQLVNPTNIVGQASVTIFAVAYRQTGAYGGIISSISPADSSPALVIENANVAVRGYGQLSGTSGGFTGPAVLCGRVSAGATEIYMDGLVRDSDAVTGSLNAATTTAIGTYRQAAANYLNGYIAEIIVYNTALSPADRARVEAYLAAKWGISGVHAPATATSDPVGYWRDKSGNGRHATQSTAGSRPTISATKQGGRTAVAFASSTRTVTSPATVAQYVADATTSPKMFFAWVARPEGGVAGITFGTAPTNPNSSSRVFFSSDYGGFGAHIVDFGSIGGARLTGTVGDEENNAGHVYSAYRDGSVVSVRRDGVEILRKTNASGSYTATNGTLSLNTAEAGGSTASWMEFMAYAASMPAANIARIERYLAARWGITLAPQVSNADAQDWINRVYANGSTVSATTAAAVNTFCESINSASGLREKFYRLNLFCGGTSGTTAGLNAALVPLYRGPSVSTTYGSTTDANAGGAAAFIGSDYSETLGLLGTASASKWLNTGFDANAAGLTVSSIHMSCVTPTYTHPVSANWLPLSIINSSATERYWLNFNSFASNTSVDSFLGLSGVYSVSYQVATTNGATIPGGLWSANRTSATDLRLYRDASQQGATNSTDASGSGVPTNAMSVFARWNGTSTFGHFGNGTVGRLMGYSVGLGLSGPQLAAYSAAMTAFNTAMGRNV